MRQCDFLVIGAGIIGLSTAHELQKKYPESKVIVLEREGSPALHQTGRNSGVIHAGVYYTPGSLKAEFCKRGNIAIKAFCREHDIPFEECGKLLVATNETELERMQGLISRAKENGIEIEVLDKRALSEKEPNISGEGAIFVPSTGIVNYRLICLRLAEIVKQHGGDVLYKEDVSYLSETESGVTVVTHENTFHAHQLIACGGVMSDRLVKLLGQEPDFRIIPFRGDYYQLPSEHNQIIKHLIYPIPDPNLPFLGIHLTKMVDGSVTVGPNAVVSFARQGYEKTAFSAKDSLDMLGYAGFRKLVWNHRNSAVQELKNAFWKRGYLKHVQKYCPLLTMEDLGDYPSGIRAQAVSRDGKLIDDFHFHTTKRCLMVCNAPSPAATSCFPIAEYIVGKISM
ncbi:L-2-hydroxyglutarate oxidase [Veronia pacifica]|uniref:Hydroxyglutarate oxidase n=1 Tax=Veronia pacifica TaxID=1080227 RepID=A0A1C3ES73_9GAMM|nr:L-2-hydroxyglutarate oxidase [Veronia pacifica]ODA36053.1 hydroxyglutarate oxidase [Veronia pacifica]